MNPQMEKHLTEKPESEKRSHASVRYTPHSPFKHRKCGNCIHFIPPSHCQGVKAPVAAPGWCERFKKEN